MAFLEVSVCSSCGMSGCIGGCMGGGFRVMNTCTFCGAMGCNGICRNQGYSRPTTVQVVNPLPQVVYVNNQQPMCPAQPYPLPQQGLCQQQGPYFQPPPFSQYPYPQGQSHHGHHHRY